MDMPADHEEFCSVCVALADLEEYEEKPLWKGRDAGFIAASAGLFASALVVNTYTDIAALSLFLFISAALLSGHGIIRHGFDALLKGRFTIDLLMSVASAGAFLIGEWAEGAAVLFLFSIAEFLEEHAADRAKGSLRELLKLAPETAVVRRDDAEIVVHAHDVSVGETVIVRPGEKIPLDGVVVKGGSGVDQSSITGESVPAHKGAGDAVYAGTMNVDGYLEVRVSKDSEHAVISRIIKLVADAQKKKSHSERFIDRFSDFYTPTVIFLAALVMIVPPLFFDAPFRVWVYRGLVLLVVSCPCALSISTPVSMVSAITSAARNGVLVKGGVYLESLGRVRAVAFDKTGTLTEGRLAVSDVISLDTWSVEDVLGIASGLERHSQHPIGKAVVEKAASDGVEPRPVVGFRSAPGKGVHGLVDGIRYSLGSPGFIEDMGFDVSRVDVRGFEESGKTAVLFADDMRVVGLIALEDTLRPEAAGVVRDLKERGLRVEMLTGDNQRVASSIARKLGIDEFHHSLLPEDKVDIVGGELKERYGGVVMVGDGVNDAPALAKADVGVAMGVIGSDVALENADVALIEDDLTRLVYLIDLGSKTTSVVKENIAFSIVVKGAFALLAIPGFISLWMAVGFGDMGLSLAVILNAMRLTAFRP